MANMKKESKDVIYHQANLPVPGASERLQSQSPIVNTDKAMAYPMALIMAKGAPASKMDV